MKLRNLFVNINTEIKRVHETPGAILVDVREKGEYADGHIPGSRNLPLTQIERAAEILPDKDAPIFLYCLSGARSGSAREELFRMGYTDVTNIGGINRYIGGLEK